MREWAFRPRWHGWRLPFAMVSCCCKGLCLQWGVHRSLACLVWLALWTGHSLLLAHTLLVAGAGAWVFCLCQGGLFGLEVLRVSGL